MSESKKSAVFPMFIDLENKLCIVIGGGKVAERKIMTLLEFGASIKVISPHLSNELLKLNIEGTISVVNREFEEHDISDAFMVIAATSDKALNRKISLQAAKNGAFVNCVDDPQLCTFLFPSVVKRDELVIGISTSGKFPGLSKKIRKDIENFIPESYGEALKELSELRRKVLELPINEEAKKKMLDSGLISEHLASINIQRG